MTVDNFNWQNWIKRFTEVIGYNDTEAVIIEVINPVYEVIGIHRLSPTEDRAKPHVYVDVLDTDNRRKLGAEVHYNSGVSDPEIIIIDRLDDIVSFPLCEKLNIWYPDGEGVRNLKPGYSYLIVFREVGKPEPSNNQIGIEIKVNQKWLASLKPDSDGNVVFYMGVK